MNATMTMATSISGIFLSPLDTRGSTIRLRQGTGSRLQPEGRFASMKEDDGRGRPWSAEQAALRPGLRASHGALSVKGVSLGILRGEGNSTGRRGNARRVSQGVACSPGGRLPSRAIYLDRYASPYNRSFVPPPSVLILSPYYPG